MGSVHTAFCDCGFSDEVTIGGSRQDFREDSAFPFYCNDCGLVEVNVAKLGRDVYVTICPRCGADGCTQYGVPPVSLKDLRPKPWPRDLVGDKHVEIPSSETITWGSRQATLTGHRCPACGQMTLEFSRYPDLLFD